MLALLPDAEVEHVGSTAVPGALTKGDVDLLAHVVADAFPTAVDLLADHYAVHQPQNWTSSLASFKDAGGTEPPVGIQLVVGGCADDALFGPFRDPLINEPALLAQYNALKGVATIRNMPLELCPERPAARPRAPLKDPLRIGVQHLTLAADAAIYRTQGVSRPRAARTGQGVTPNLSRRTGMTARVAARAAAAAFVAHEGAAQKDKLASAIAVGHRLIDLKAICPPGTYEATVWATGIPLSTARLFARLARNAGTVEESRATSIAEASALLAISRRRSPTRRGATSLDLSEETSTSLVALAKALGVAILETAAIESAVHGTDFADMIDAYVARAVELSADAAASR